MPTLPRSTWVYLVAAISVVAIYQQTLSPSDTWWVAISHKERMARAASRANRPPRTTTDSSLTQRIHDTLERVDTLDEVYCFCTEDIGAVALEHAKCPLRES